MATWSYDELVNNDEQTSPANTQSRDGELNLVNNNVQRPGVARRHPKLRDLWTTQRFQYLFHTRKRSSISMRNSCIHTRCRGFVIGCQTARKSSNVLLLLPTVGAITKTKYTICFSEIALINNFQSQQPSECNTLCVYFSCLPNGAAAKSIHVVYMYPYRVHKCKTCNVSQFVLQ